MHGTHPPEMMHFSTMGTRPLHPRTVQRGAPLSLGKLQWEVPTTRIKTESLQKGEVQCFPVRQTQNDSKNAKKLVLPNASIKNRVRFAMTSNLPTSLHVTRNQTASKNGGSLEHQGTTVKKSSEMNSKTTHRDLTPSMQDRENETHRSQSLTPPRPPNSSTEPPSSSQLSSLLAASSTSYTCTTASTETLKTWTALSAS